MDVKYNIDQIITIDSDNNGSKMEGRIIGIRMMRLSKELEYKIRWFDSNNSINCCWFNESNIVTP